MRMGDTWRSPAGSRWRTWADWPRGFSVLVLSSRQLTSGVALRDVAEPGVAVASPNQQLAYCRLVAPLVIDRRRERVVGLPER